MSQPKDVHPFRAPHLKQGSRALAMEQVKEVVGDQGFPGLLRAFIVSQLALFRDDDDPTKGWVVGICHEHLGDGDGFVRREAVRTLGKFGKFARNDFTAQALDTRFAVEQEDFVKGSILTAMGRIGHLANLKPVVQALKHPAFAEKAVKALTYYGGDAKVAIDLLLDPEALDEVPQGARALVLGLIGDLAIPAIVKAVSEAKDEKRVTMLTHSLLVAMGAGLERRRQAEPELTLPVFPDE